MIDVPPTMATPIVGGQSIDFYPISIYNFWEYSLKKDGAKAMDNHVLIDAQFKDSSPMQTVNRIRGILAENGIEIRELWRDTCVPYCHALSIEVVGTNFSVNGKGLSKEFALASAYGELMERMQLGYIQSLTLQKDGVLTQEAYADSFRSAAQLWERNSGWYQLIAKRLKQLTGISKTGQQILKRYADSSGNVAVTPFFCLTTGTKEYYPKLMRSRVYTSNGCAAGNTMEEAIVQAMSETVERHHLVQISDGNISLPSIPDEVLKQYKTAYEIITFIRNQGYRVTVKDCSLGKKYPVICVSIVNTKNGYYHNHFGAYPIFEIALERALTESFQGHTIHNITTFREFLWKKPGELSVASISHEITRGSYEKTPRFFLSRSDVPYNQDMGFHGSNNKELLQECIAYFKEQGYDILVRDSSCLGFCTCQVVIPGYSEVFIHRVDLNHDEPRFSAMAVQGFRNPSASPVPVLLGMLMHQNEMSRYSSDIRGAHGFQSATRLAVKLPPNKDKFLLCASLAYVYYALQKPKDVLKWLSKMLLLCDNDKADFLLCLKRYLSLVTNNYEAEEIRNILEYLHTEETVSKLYTCLEAKKNPFDEFILHCSPDNCESCPIRACCNESHSVKLANLIKAKQSLLDFDAFCAQLSTLI